MSDSTVFEVEEHLAFCSQCRSHLDQLAEEGAPADTPLLSLTQAFIISGFESPDPELAPRKQSYPDFETIAAYVDGTLPQERTTEFEALMRQLPRLAQEVAELRAPSEELPPTPTASRASTVANEIFGKVHPMVVKPVVELPIDSKTWWKRWSWPVQSFGLATATALFIVLFAVKPWQQNLPNQQAQPTPGVVAIVEAPPLNGGTQRGGNEDFTPTQKRLLALSNARSDSQELLSLVKIVPYKVQGSFDNKRVWHSSSAPDARQPLVSSQRLEFKVGEGVQFRFENQAKQTLYLALLWMGKDGSITPVTLLTPDSPVTKLTPRGTLDARLSTRTYGIGPTVGMEKIKLFVSTRPINPNHLKFDGTRKNLTKPTGTLSPLDVAITQALGMS
ncbi:MAG: hypothetical protein EOO38_15965, partial [Cytophagaceae bacterium]